jgi:hypothetical protein
MVGTVVEILPDVFCVIVAHRRIAGMAARKLIIAKFRAWLVAPAALRRLPAAARADDRVRISDFDVLAGHRW